MLKYFSSVVERPINTGGRKLIYDMQKTIKNFLINEKIQHKEYGFKNLRNAIHLVLPSPYAKYLIFGYLGNPFLTPPLVVAYSFIFCFIALKKKIAREKFYLIVVDLIEWQSTLWSSRKDRMYRFFRIFQCFLERIMISYVADEVISLADKEFMMKNYGVRKVHEIEFLDHYIDSKSRSIAKPKSLKVMYAGDLSSRRGFDIEFLGDILKNLNDSCELLVVARGLEEDTEKELRKFRNFRFLGQLDAEKLDNIARECHFGLILYSPEYLYYNIAPSIKLSFYLATGLTVISTNLKRTKQLNDKYNFGYILNREEMLQFIRDLSPSKIKRNKNLQEQIANGKFLFNVLTKINLS